MSIEKRVGVLGATSLIGSSLLQSLEMQGYEILAFTRRNQALRGGQKSPKSVSWRQVDGIFDILQTTRHSWSQSIKSSAPYASKDCIEQWVSLVPIWVLPAYFSMISASGAKRIVALSSTSRYSKRDSSDPIERDVATRLIEGEEQLARWADQAGIEWVILQPTMIYAPGLDRNINEIERVICRLGFFPLLGAAHGRRQPVHADDVATACVAALASSKARNKTYILSGAEVLTYREMVGRVFRALGRTERFITIPSLLFKIAIASLRVLPRFRYLSITMAQRMNNDLVFGHEDAAQDLGFAPRMFEWRTPRLARSIPEGK